MKKSILALVAALVLMASWTASAEQPTAKARIPRTVESTLPAAVQPVKVYYFHYTRRCVTCKAVESETQKALQTFYASQIKNRKLVFRSINLDEKSSLALAQQCKAEGQALLVIAGNKRMDLTDSGFLYAKSQAGKWRDILKKTLDPLLK